MKSYNRAGSTTDAKNDAHQMKEEFGSEGVPIGIGGSSGNSAILPAEEWDWFSLKASPVPAAGRFSLVSIGASTAVAAGVVAVGSCASSNSGIGGTLRGVLASKGLVNDTSRRFTGSELADGTLERRGCRSRRRSSRILLVRVIACTIRV